MWCVVKTLGGYGHSARLICVHTTHPEFEQNKEACHII